VHCGVGRTFVVFPILGLVARALVHSVLPRVCTHRRAVPVPVPSTCSRRLAFTSIAHGNVPGSDRQRVAVQHHRALRSPRCVVLLMHTNGAPRIGGGRPGHRVQLLLYSSRSIATGRGWAAWLQRHTFVTRRSTRLDPARSLHRVLMSMAEKHRENRSARGGWCGRRGVCPALLAIMLGSRSGVGLARLNPRRCQRWCCSAAPRKSWRRPCQGSGVLRDTGAVGPDMLRRYALSPDQLFGCRSSRAKVANRACD